MSGWNQRSVSTRARRLVPFVPLVAATALLAQRSISAVLQKVGHPAPTPDDAYIHFQYARAIAEGHPLRFQAGEAISTGATSFLWPAMLAPFYLAPPILIRENWALLLAFCSCSVISRSSGNPPTPQTLGGRFFVI